MTTKGSRQRVIKQLKEQLSARFDELREEIRQELLASDNEHYNQLAEAVHDLGDESVADLLSDVNLAVIDRHVKELQEVDAALLSVAKGVYGLCADCNEEIELERLRAYPMAVRCHDCQTRHERSYLQPGHPRL